MYIERVALPGIGINHILTFSDGRRLGVICHFDGRRELTMYDTADPDAVPGSVVLSADEADRLSDVLNEVVTVDHLTVLETALDGVDLAKIPVAAGSVFAGRSLADTRARSRTRASVVAVIRDGRVIASPESSLVFQAGDVIVAAGSNPSVAELGRLVAAGDR